MSIQINQLMAPKIGKTTVLVRKRVNSLTASSEIHECRVPQTDPYPDGLFSEPAGEKLTQLRAKARSRCDDMLARHHQSKRTLMIGDEAAPLGARLSNRLKAASEDGKSRLSLVQRSAGGQASRRRFSQTIKLPGL
jgi:hypothetical protein